MSGHRRMVVLAVWLVAPGLIEPVAAVLHKGEGVHDDLGPGTGAFGWPFGRSPSCLMPHPQISDRTSAGRRANQPSRGSIPSSPMIGGRWAWSQPDHRYALFVPRKDTSPMDSTRSPGSGYDVSSSSGTETGLSASSACPSGITARRSTRDTPLAADSGPAPSPRGDRDDRAHASTAVNSAQHACTAGAPYFADLNYLQLSSTIFNYLQLSMKGKGRRLSPGGPSHRLQH